MAIELQNLIGNIDFLRSWLIQIFQSDPTALLDLNEADFALLPLEIQAALANLRALQVNATPLTDEQWIAAARGAFQEAEDLLVTVGATDMVAYWKKVGWRRMEELWDRLRGFSTQGKNCLGQIQDRVRYATEVAELEQAAARIDNIARADAPYVFDINQYIQTLFQAVFSVCSDVQSSCQIALDRLPSQTLAYGDCPGLQLWVVTGGAGKFFTAQSYLESANEKIANVSDISTDLANHDVDVMQLTQAIEQASYNTNALSDAIQTTQLMLDQCGLSVGQPPA